MYYKYIREPRRRKWPSSPPNIAPQTPEDAGRMGLPSLRLFRSAAVFLGARRNGRWLWGVGMIGSPKTVGNC